MSLDAPQTESHASSGIFPPEEEMAIYVKNAYKTFGVTKALNGVSFRANAGEIHAIVGGNGCGKSTLAKVLSGVLPVDKGEVSIFGHSPRSPSEARKLGVAMVFQEIMVADEATIAENLFAGTDGLWSKALSTREKLSRARVLMRELVGTEIDPQRLAAGLSLGIKAWITIGRALLFEPRILILDESSASLDFDSTERLFQRMRELRDRGAAVLIVTHRIAELIRVCDRATVMRDGKNVGVLAKSEITEDNLLRFMAGKEGARAAVEKRSFKANGNHIVLKASALKVWPNSEAVNFDLRKGEIVGVTGLEGHGQDSFVRILAGVTPAAESFPAVQLAGSVGSVEIRSLEQAKKSGIEFVSGDRKREGILPNLNIFENLLIPLYRLHKRGGEANLISWAELQGVFDWEVQRLSIKTGPQTNLIASLSGGNQQKVLIGRAFALRPRILVLNDPARGIDVGTKQELYQHLRDFAAEGNAVVYMSSELEEFMGLCSRVIVFRHGSIFDVLVDDDVDPVRILEAMFGQRRAKQNGASKAFPQVASGAQETRPVVGAARVKHPDPEMHIKAARIARTGEANENTILLIEQNRGGGRGMPDYSESDLKAIQSLMTFDDAGDGCIGAPANGRPPARSFTIGYAKADHDQFAKLMNFDVSARQPEPIPLQSDPWAVEKAGEQPPFYTNSDLALFGRITLPGFVGLIFDSRPGAGRAEAGETPGDVTYASHDLKAFSDLMQFQPETTEQVRRQNPGSGATMKIVDMDKERAAERRTLWSRQAGMKIVFSDAEGRKPRALT